MISIPKAIAPLVASVRFHCFEPSCLVCCVELVGGYVVVGKTAVARSTEFDAAVAERIALGDAVRQICELQRFHTMTHGQRGASGPHAAASRADADRLADGVSVEGALK